MNIKNNTIGKIVTALFLAVALVFSVALMSSCGEDSQNANSPAKGSKDNPVKIGVVGASDSHWIAFKKAAESEGIYVDIKDFAEYTEPNPALAQGELDLNEFQHILFLAKHNVDSGDGLVPIAATAVYPISLYGDTTKNITSKSDIKAGDQIAIPQDGTNQSRALYLLDSAGLITLNSNAAAIATPADIDKANSLVTVLPVSAAETPAAVSDPKVVGAVVNNDFVTNLSEANQVNKLATESADSEGAKPYINIWVSRPQDKDNELFNKLAKIFGEDKNVRAANIADAGKEENIKFINDLSQSELATILQDQEKVYKESK